MRHIGVLMLVLRDLLSSPEHDEKRLIMKGKGMNKSKDLYVKIFQDTDGSFKGYTKHGNKYYFDDLGYLSWETCNAVLFDFAEVVKQ